MALTLRTVNAQKPRASRTRLELPIAAWRCCPRMMNLAETWGLRPDGSNPCRHVEKFPERAPKPFLTADELTRLGAALMKAEKGKAVLPQFAALVGLLMFTGARKTRTSRPRRRGS